MTRSTIRILILDDETFIHKLLALMLAKLGFTEVTACDNGVEALGLIGSPMPPDLILLDLNMPGMDGIEFVRKLVEHGYSGSVILVSGEDERVMMSTEHLIQAHRITVLGQLSKPVSLSGLAAMTDRWRPSEAPHAPRKIYGAGELGTAIANGELTNYYQPKVDVASGDVVGVETLVRWRHPADGLVLPDQFIGTAEDDGLIDELTLVVLTGALAQATAWRQAGLNLRVAVNLSMDSFSSVAFADFVAGAVAAAGVVPQDIILEVAESRLMLDQRAPLEVLTRLRMKRFRLSIDDFGTGHSSLSQLRDFPFDELKIDRSFVHGASRDKTLRAIYATSLGLGKLLGMEVVAEGVEDRDDWDLVRDTGCALAQGYFIARPMPAADLAGWIPTWRQRVREFADDVS
ncbi:EAL domain-containing response regulator [Cryobacterium tagatosivorans]|uniref:EAL domain-containing protein n=1 Tax=Cryobacterium tagatosivorans TaxID=1259199 RepID=A0A4R8UDA6_9MICO|nr:EAL domain-containing response regulator [Cryobacterium tagatosivorans]TFB49969.1 EAL domain-containing protein [Cryobacterium tagatosivorans]